MSGTPRITDAELEAYLDDQMTAEQRALFERRLAVDPPAQQACAEYRSLDDKLRSALRPRSVTVEQIEGWLPADPATATRIRSSGRRRLVLGGLAVAATVAWLIVLWQWRSDRAIEPFFEPQALCADLRRNGQRGFSSLLPVRRRNPFRRYVRQTPTSAVALGPAATRTRDGRLVVPWGIEPRHDGNARSRG